jgi:carbon-monoxide dehydrogenase large subunit
MSQGLRRREDARLLAGRGHFVDDCDRAGQAHLRVVRAVPAHARILSIDTAPATTLAGVVMVITAPDLEGMGPIPVRLSVPGHPLGPFLQPVLATDRVRYAGEPVAAVVAEDPYVAEDAAELVEVYYEELPAVLGAGAGDPGSACAPELFLEGNEAGVIEAGYGDLEDAWARASQVVELTLEVGRHTAVPLEPRGLVADYDPRNHSLEIWGATKVPQYNRRVLAELLRLPESSIRLHAGDAGGGFGVRGELYPEDVLVAWAARRLERPVKWIEDRAEHLVGANHSRQQRHRVAAAFSASGTLLALTDEVVHDNGAYMRTHGLTVPELTATMLPGPYRVPAYRSTVRAVLTNKTPCGTYRAPGRYETTFVREHLLDVAADRLGIDRLELRRRNLLLPGEMPHSRPLRTLGTDLVLDAGDYPALLDRACAQVVNEGWPEEVRAARAGGELAGIGVAMFLEKSGLGPSETAEVVVGVDGRVRVHSGATSLGQGVETALARIAAGPLHLDFHGVEVVAGDTALQPEGFGSWASRSTVVAGGATHLAAVAVAERVLEMASRLLEVSPEDLRLFEGTVAVAGVPSRRLTLAEVAAACQPGSAYLFAGEPVGLAASRRFEVATMTYPYGAHAALVLIDAGTGQVEVARYLVAYEVGKAIDPVLVEGQMVGGAAQGLGGALLEELRYDEKGQPLATTFMDYLLPSAAEVPRVEVLLLEESPSPHNPLGVRGAGEGGVAGVGAAVANAVRDALRLKGAVGCLPLTPERVLALLGQR